MRQSGKSGRKWTSTGRNIPTDVKDLLAMVTFQLSVENLKLEDKNDTSPFTEKIQELTDELESYLKDK